MKTKTAIIATRCAFIGVIAGGVLSSPLTFWAGYLYNTPKVTPVALKSPDSTYCKPFRVDTVLNSADNNPEFPGLLADSVGCPVSQEMVVYWKPVVEHSRLGTAD